MRTRLNKFKLNLSIIVSVFSIMWSLSTTDVYGCRCYQAFEYSTHEADHCILLCSVKGELLCFSRKGGAALWRLCMCAWKVSVFKVSYNFMSTNMVRNAFCKQRSQRRWQGNKIGTTEKWKKKIINEREKREKEKGRGKRKGGKGRRKKEENKKEKRKNKITKRIIIDRRKGWREGNGLDRVEHWFKYRQDDYSETGRAGDRRKDRRK